MLWIHYNFHCGLETQIKLHKIFRAKISEWFKTDLISRFVLTFHYHPIFQHKCDSLYLCLEISSVRLPSSRSSLVSDEILKQIPVEIESTTRKISSIYLINSPFDKLEVKDYEWELISGNASKVYNNSSIEEILRFASKGTEVALETLGSIKTRNETWGTDANIVNSIKKRIQAILISDRERGYGLHFVCNSAFLAPNVEIIIRKIMKQQIDGNRRGILEFLYEIEKTGNFWEARRRFLKEYIPRLIK